MKSRVWLSFWVATAHFWLKSSFSFICIPKPFSSGLLSIHLSHSLYWYQGLSQLKFRTCLVELQKVIPLKPFQAQWGASHLSTAPLSLVSPTNLLQVPSPKILNSIACSMDLWGIPPIAGCHLDTELLTITLWMWSSSQFLIHQPVYPSSPYPSTPINK